MEKFEAEIKKALKKLGIKDISLERPPAPELGDYSFPCFSASKQLKKDPNTIAQELCKKIDLGKWIKKVEIKGPYLNFFISEKKLTPYILDRIQKEKEKFGSSNVGKGRKALVEHTSVNPNASPHVGRARNAMIGDFVSRILKFQGYKTEVHYYVNDIGKQIALLILGCRDKKKVGFNDLLDLYVKISAKMEKNPKIEKQVFDLLKQLEDGDKKTRAEFTKIVDICIKGQVNIFKDFGIHYDSFDPESKYLYDGSTNKILKKLEKTGKVFTDEDGRKVLDQKEFKLPMKVPVLVLTRRDGTSLYVLRDLAYTIEKMKKTKHNYWVLGEDHKLYYQQIQAALSLLKTKAPNITFYSFILLTEGKMSTRKGNLVLLEDFMNEAVSKAKKEIIKRHGKIKNLEKLSKTIGYGAVKFSILKVSPEKNVLFNWESALNFEGESAPYIQYSHARICSILKTYKKKLDRKINYKLLFKDKEITLLKKLSEFPEMVEKSTKDLKPHMIAGYSVELAQRFSEFYHSCNILKADKDVKKARLILADSVRITLRNSLSILGIEAPEKM